MPRWTNLIQKTLLPFVVLHTALLLAYGWPGGMVPQRIEYWAQAYARPLFHQQWSLFAPEPPACGCHIFMVDSSGEAVDLAGVRNTLVWQRMVSSACRYAEMTGSGEALPQALSGALVELACHAGMPAQCDARLVRTCQGTDHGVEQRVLSLCAARP
jgi:hypothetical protein